MDEEYLSEYTGIEELERLLTVHDSLNKKTLLRLIKEEKEKRNNLINNFMEKLNPYPENIFSEPTPEEYDRMHKAFKEYGLSSDKFFGSWGRTVWNNYFYTLKDILCDD